MHSCVDLLSCGVSDAVVKLHNRVCVRVLRDLYAETQVAEVLVQILSAVDYLHSRRVIHLDLKSDNMLVDDGNHLKIVDFGSAQSFTPGQPLSVEHIQGLSDSKGNDVEVFKFLN